MEPLPPTQPDTGIFPLASALQEGPFQSRLPMSHAEWFTTAAALAPAIAKGIEAITSLPPELSNQLSQTPLFAPAIAETRSALPRPILSSLCPCRRTERWCANVIADAVQNT